MAVLLLVVPARGVLEDLCLHPSPHEPQRIRNHVAKNACEARTCGVESSVIFLPAKGLLGLQLEEFVYWKVERVEKGNTKY